MCLKGACRPACPAHKGPSASTLPSSPRGTDTAPSFPHLVYANLVIAEIPAVSQEVVEGGADLQRVCRRWQRQQRRPGSQAGLRRAEGHALHSVRHIGICQREQRALAGAHDRSSTQLIPGHPHAALHCPSCGGGHVRASTRHLSAMPLSPQPFNLHPPPPARTARHVNVLPRALGAVALPEVGLVHPRRRHLPRRAQRTVSGYGALG